MFLIRLLTGDLSLLDVVGSVIELFCPKCRESSPRTLVKEKIHQRIGHQIVINGNVIYNQQDNDLVCDHCEHRHKQHVNVTPTTIDTNGYALSAALVDIRQYTQNPTIVYLHGELVIVSGPRLPLVIRALYHAPGQREQRLAIARIAPPRTAESRTSFTLPIKFERLPEVLPTYAGGMLPDHNMSLDLEVATQDGVVLDRIPEGIDLFWVYQRFTEDHWSEVEALNGALADLIRLQFEFLQKIIEAINDVRRLEQEIDHKLEELIRQMGGRTHPTITILEQRMRHLDQNLMLLLAEQGHRRQLALPLMIESTQRLLGDS